MLHRKQRPRLRFHPKKWARVIQLTNNAATNKIHLVTTEISIDWRIIHQIFLHGDKMNKDPKLGYQVVWYQLFLSHMLRLLAQVVFRFLFSSILAQV